MRSQPGKLTVLPELGLERSGSVSALSEHRRRLAERVTQARVERVLGDLDVANLAPVQARVLRVIIRAVVEGRQPKAWQLAADTDLTLKELERACDALLARGLIGPGPDRRPKGASE